MAYRNVQSPPYIVTPLGAPLLGLVRAAPGAVYRVNPMEYELMPPYAYPLWPARNGIYPNPGGGGSDLDRTPLMKDIAIRGRARAIRTSYLTDNSKFETELNKYMERKGKSDVPDDVVDLLFEFINTDGYENWSALDEVTLCILAHNVGAKSAVQFSLSNLKDLGEQLSSIAEIVKIIACILLSSKVEPKLSDWLEGFLKRNYQWLFRALPNCREWLELCFNHPELVMNVEEMLGMRPGRDDSGYRRL